MVNKWLGFAQKALIFKSVFLLCCSVFAEIQITGTRVIFPAQKKEVSVALQNTGKRPVLIQSWVDSAQTNDEIKTDELVPFLITPPLLRVEPGQNAVLRILRTGGDFADDRESLFWLNVQEIPEQSKAENALQFAVISRLKLFIRPSKLDMPSDEVYARLDWKVSTQNQHLGFQITNPTPYFITITGLRVNGAINLSAPEMLPPYGQIFYSLAQQKIVAEQITNLSYQTINDFGAMTQAFHVIPRH